MINNNFTKLIDDKELDLCQVFRHIFWKDVILSYLNLFQFLYW